MTFGDKFFLVALKKELSNGIHRIISFIRQQENDLLVPIHSEVQELNTSTRHQARLLEKEMLKRKFRKILDFYITHRETLGWAASGAKKTELAEQAR